MGRRFGAGSGVRALLALRHRHPARLAGRDAFHVLGGQGALPAQWLPNLRRDPALLVRHRESLHGGGPRRADRQSDVVCQPGQDRLPQRPLRPRRFSASARGDERRERVYARPALAHSHRHPAHQRCLLRPCAFHPRGEAQVVCPRGGCAGAPRRLLLVRAKRVPENRLLQQARQRDE